MEIEKLLANSKYRTDADRVMRRVLNAPELLGELMQLMLKGGDGALVQRASMVAGNLGRIQPGWLLPYLDRMVESAAKPQHPAVQRNILRYLSELPPETIPERIRGKTVDLALRVTDSTEEAVASRVFAMQIAANFCALYPELAGELRTCLEFHIPRGSPGFRSRGLKILSHLPE
ncbi:MAG: hypothetical protein WA952_09500 [Lewinella sp.]